MKFPFPPAFGAKLNAPKICRLSIYRHFVSAPALLALHPPKHLLKPKRYSVSPSSISSSSDSSFQVTYSALVSCSSMLDLGFSRGKKGFFFSSRDFRFLIEGLLFSRIEEWQGKVGRGFWLRRRRRRTKTRTRRSPFPGLPELDFRSALFFLSPFDFGEPRK